MWNVLRWAVSSNERAVANARAAAVDCSRRRLERAEVDEYLRRRGVTTLELAPGGRPLRVNQR